MGVYAEGRTDDDGRVPQEAFRTLKLQQHIDYRTNH